MRNGRKPGNLEGMTFGRLKPLEVTELRRNGSAVWRCECECGAQRLVAARDLVSGRTRSCGCSRKGPRGQRLQLNVVTVDREQIEAMTSTDTLGFAADMLPPTPAGFWARTRQAFARLFRAAA